MSSAMCRVTACDSLSILGATDSGLDLTDVIDTINKQQTQDSHHTVSSAQLSVSQFQFIARYCLYYSQPIVDDDDDDDVITIVVMLLLLLLLLSTRTPNNNNGSYQHILTTRREKADFYV